jgi:hypothetical protein
MTYALADDRFHDVADDEWIVTKVMIHGLQTVTHPPTNWLAVGWPPMAIVNFKLTDHQ